MNVSGQNGVDGPYPAPIVLPSQQVEAAWIDYNGHMNVAYYTLAFDRALDSFLEDWLGIGETWVKARGQGPYVLQAHVHYLAELLEGEAFHVRLLLLAADRKRMHLFLSMIRNRDEALCATQEVVLLNVDHEKRRAAAYPDWAVARMTRMAADHAALPRPEQAGRPIGLTVRK
ncbi:thioesterase family protein [Oceanibium sediminis]|uniref:thioesterase family protein n=1 Tax=Oceanibium sediminis TaxID=2026339 RepID=UPI000DD41235|nr:thioesterase family protein [Oceanibium sediminis]